MEVRVWCKCRPLLLIDSTQYDPLDCVLDHWVRNDDELVLAADTKEP